jgi:hypothetical protein
LRRCNPDLAAWHSDSPEYSNLRQLKRDVCFGASVYRMNFGNMSLLTSNTYGEITTYIACSAMPTPWQPMPISHRPMLTEASKICDKIL